jgi:pilus assembly protein CpaE
MIHVLIGTPDPTMADRCRALLGEADDVNVLSSPTTARGVTDALVDEDEPLDVVVLHQELGPLPVLDLARDLNHRFPHVGVVLLAHEPSMELLHAAMAAGIRSVVRLPPTFSELYAAVEEASEWSQTFRRRVEAAGVEKRAGRSRGRMIALAGSKGGVGTTVLATQLALELQHQHAERRVCLVDLDLQTGDVRSYLDVSHRRSITDLVDVAAELTTAQLVDATFAHASGLQVLLPPREGELGEDLDGASAARILGGIRARFDVVVVDCGSVMSEAAASAIELADDVLVVCTPDVVSLRGANRLIELWERLAVRNEDIKVLLNRAGKEREIQPALAERVVRAPLLDTVVPDRPQDLERMTNTGDPDRMDGAVRRATHALAGELDRPLGRTDVADEEKGTAPSLVARLTGQTGALSAEFVALLVPVVATVLVLWQLLLAGYTTVLATHAANEGARVLAVAGADHAAITAAAQDRLHGHWADTVEVVAVDGQRVTVAIPVPILAPGMSAGWRVRSTADTVREDVPTATARPDHASARP